MAILLKTVMLPEFLFEQMRQKPFAIDQASNYFTKYAYTEAKYEYMNQKV
jgi:hypothetical protein